MLSAYEVAELRPLVFSSPFQVLRLAKARVIPCSVVPRGMKRRFSYLFELRKVDAAMAKMFKPAAV